MPCIGLGTWKATGEQVKKAVKDAIDCGYRHIDTAAIYKNEAEIGEALSEVFSEGTIRREDIFVTSKLWNDAHHEASVLPALQESLRKLQLDYLDLYLIHWPVAFKPGIAFATSPSEYIPLEQLPITETWKGMVAAKEQGLARHIGVSNFSTTKLTELLSKTTEVPEVNQVELHPLLQQPELHKYCRENDIHLTGYSPLGSGDRSAQMKAPDEPSLMEIPLIRELADQHDCSPAQILLAWHVNRETSVIPKSTTPVHIKSNLEAQDIVLDMGEMDAIATLDRNYRYVNGKFFEMPGSGYSDIYDEA